MPLNINFNHNWSCYHRATAGNEDLVTLTVTNAIDDFNWSPVELPHMVDGDKENILDNKFEQWWYRKQFQYFPSDQPEIRTICLTFRSSGGNMSHTHNSIPSSTSIVVWLNGIKLCFGSLCVPHISIDLPEKLLNSFQAESFDHKHTLIVCCLNTCLSFNASLTVSEAAIFSIKDIQFDETITNTVNLSQQQESIYKYVASFNDIEKRIETVSDSNQLFPPSIDEKRELLDIVTGKTSEDVINNELSHDNSYLSESNRCVVPLLNIVMLIVGSRGDVEPFIAYGKALRAVGHRVRLATHEKFRKFVRDHDLEFFPLAGDPAEIMAFMVKNSGIVPSLSTLVKGDIFRRRRLFFDILKSTWLACTSNNDETGAPFRAEAIIANPISYGHIHCAEKLGVPLHMVFTMPYSPTSTFPHPLANVDYSKAPRERLNVFSYSLVETLMWLGIGDLINKFRRTILDLPSLHIRQVVSMMIDEKVPYTYCWSPSLIPKPLDWPFHIDVSGYFFLGLGKNYTTPPTDLLIFLGLHSESNNQMKDTSPPIFIGFGSIIGHDSRRLLDIVLKSLMQTGYRALLSGFEIDADQLPKTVFKIDDIPYDWLFQHVSAVCHHGGAGTTATGLRAGKPTITVPFFGDQFFWGNIIAKNGAGPPPLPGKDLTVEQLVDAFKFVHMSTTQAAAKRVQEVIAHEDGCSAAVRAFHANLPMSQMRSDLEPTFPACFRLDEFNLQVSRPVAQVLLSAGVVDESQFRYHSTRHWHLTHHHTSKSDIHDRPRTDDFQLMTTAIKSPMYYILTNDVHNAMNKPRADSDRRRTSSAAVDTLIGDVNRMMKPIINALLSPTDSGQNKYPTMKISSSQKMDAIDQTTDDKFINTSTSLATNSNDLFQYNPTDISILARNAANISGFSSEVCQHILLEFTKLKKQRVQIPMFSLTKHNPLHPFTLQRSHSFHHL